MTIELSELSDLSKVKALHPHWTGTLSISDTDNTIRHDLYGSSGRYKLEGTNLTIDWDKYPPETFIKIGNSFIHESMLKDLPRLQQMLSVSLAGQLFEAKAISIAIPNSDVDVSLRLGTSDIQTFEQIFIRNEYNSPHLPSEARVVLDLGANIGLSAAFFALRYPNARIVAVEPDPDNYSLLLKNVERFGPRVVPLRAAAWSRDGTIELETEDAEGNTLESWGPRGTEGTGNFKNPVQCYSVGTMIDQFNLSMIDLLKVDIEGGEFEIFSRDPGRWLSRVNAIVVETHDRFRQGSESADRTALAQDFVESPRLVENLFFTRR